MISLSEVKTAFSKCVNRAAGGRERIVVTSQGHPKAALIGSRDMPRLEEFEDSLIAHEGASDGAVALAELKGRLHESADNGPS